MHLIRPPILPREFRVARSDFFGDLDYEQAAAPDTSVSPGRALSNWGNAATRHVGGRFMPSPYAAAGPAVAPSRQAGYPRAVSYRVMQVGPRCLCRRRVPAQGARAVGC
jgi:hypothetical protein